jgi:hypothetical protein
LLPQPDEHLLHHIVGDAVVTRDVACDGVGRAAVAPVRLFECFVMPTRDGEHERGVAALAHVLHVVHLVHGIPFATELDLG